MDRHQRVGLFGVRVDALGDVDDPDPRNFSCCITRMASGMSRAMRELSSTSSTSNGFGLPAAAESRR